MANTRPAVSIRPANIPPGQYPNTYPDNRLPGGIPMPPIRLPGRKPKDKPKGKKKFTAPSRRSTEHCENWAKKMCCCKLESKSYSAFACCLKPNSRIKSGEAIRDSLLHPGDQLSVQVSPDDEETALNVILLRAGSANDRYTAELPVEDGVIRDRARRTSASRAPSPRRRREGHPATRRRRPGRWRRSPNLTRRPEGAKSEPEAPAPVGYRAAAGCRPWRSAPQYG